MDIGRRIRELREARGLTQKQVEALAGITQNHLSRLEVGRFVPSLHILELLATALEIEPSLFLVGAGRMHSIPGRARGGMKLRRQDQRMLEAFRSLPKKDQKLLLSLALWLKNKARRP